VLVQLCVVQFLISMFLHEIMVLRHNLWFTVLLNGVEELFSKIFRSEFRNDSVNKFSG
jgi:hypothetical protein